MEIFVIWFVISITLCQCIYVYLHKNKLEKMLVKEQQLSDFSSARMKLMHMVASGEISIDSSFFKYVYSATSYSIRALFFYEDKAKALDNINILKTSIPHLLNENIDKELLELNNEQKEIFCQVTANVLLMYLDYHVIEKLLFSAARKNLAKYVQKNKSVSEIIEYPEKLYNYSAMPLAA